VQELPDRKMDGKAGRSARWAATAQGRTQGKRAVDALDGKAVQAAAAESIYAVCLDAW